MAKSSVEFIVYGEARPQGSKRAFSVKTKTGKNVVRVVEDNKHVKDWRQQVAATAIQAWGGSPLGRTVPVKLTLHFVRPRPGSHFGTGRNSGKLKDSAPDRPTTKPDTIKVARAVEDALTGIIWHDDSQVVEHVLRKTYGDPHQVFVRVDVLTGGLEAVR